MRFSPRVNAQRPTRSRERIDEDHRYSTTYFNPVSKKQKEVIYRVGTVKGGQEVTLQAAEVQAYKWVELWTANEALTYKEDQDMVEEVLCDMM